MPDRLRQYITKPELRRLYVEARDAYSEDRIHIAEYAARIDAMLANYFGLPLSSPSDDEEGE